MSRNPSPFLRLALAGVLAASFALGACGRKGDLDPPPASLVAGEQPKSAGKPEDGPKDYRGRLLAPAGVNKPIPLDVLLN